MDFKKVLSREASFGFKHFKKTAPFSLTFAGLQPQAKSFFLVGALWQTKKKLIFLTAHAGEVYRIYHEVKSFLNHFTQRLPVKIFPGFEIIPGLEKLHDPADSAGSFEVLDFLTSSSDRSEAGLILTTVKSFLFKFSLPKKKTGNFFLSLKPGLKLPFEKFLLWLEEAGYKYSDLVEGVGQFSRRGGLVDVFPGNLEFPVRIEFFADEIASIRAFDVGTQLSRQPMNFLKIFPVEPTGSGSHHLLEFLPQGSLLILDEPSNLASIAQNILKELSDIKTSFFARTSEEMMAKIRQQPAVVNLLQFGGATSEEISLELETVPEFKGQLATIKQNLSQWLTSGQKVVLVSRFTGRLKEILGSWQNHKNLEILSGDLMQGFKVGSLFFLSDLELFGFQRNLRDPILRPPPPAAEGEKITLKEGDYLVHWHHGIGRYLGLRKLRMAGVENEYLLLEYASGDKLFVPAHQLELVERYSGFGKVPRLAFLGGRRWLQTKQKTRQFTTELARKLFYLYQKRKKQPGYSFPADTSWQKEMEEAFPYEETPHQKEAIEAVKKDLESPHPMERLILGDVGYGKTEVALRAAFKVATSGKQVVLLTPTTILADQHYENFLARLGAFPLQIALLSRFQPPAEQKKIVQEIAEGRVDIVIGTHRLLSKDVSFKDLGLLIIDEEQRFGVIHKEKIKTLKNNVEVLLLSATPIPRTFYLALSGVSDLSLITTPPENRLPIKTVVTSYNHHLIKEAIIFELERDGQIYFVHNRIQSIQKVADFLQKLLPGLKIGLIHGRLEEEEIEKEMVAFREGRTRLLLATAIIENGLDLPNVNTLIVNDAQRFGLSELYQLRGRVGRSDRQAYAYLFFNAAEVLTDTARLRLQAIKDFSQLGDGYRLAERDLEIRGAGNLYGTEQHGHIAQVGFSFYCRLLEESVRELKGETVAPDFEPELKLNVSAHLPENYLKEESLRLAQYRRLLKTGRDVELAKVAEELRDRFGPLPEVVQNLLAVARIKFLARQLKFKKIERQSGQVSISLAALKFTERQKLQEVVFKKLKRHFFTEENLILIITPQKDSDFLAGLERELRKLLIKQD
jgi:transcription-repair coupling factor (superfamily II helicase)